jgi:signal transduction histidine kinase
VVNAGGAVRSADAQHGRAGHGIAGMRERCRMLGGDLAAGETPGGGFQVTARLPLAASEVPA